MKMAFEYSRKCIRMATQCGAFKWWNYSLVVRKMQIHLEARSSVSVSCVIWKIRQLGVHISIGPLAVWYRSAASLRNCTFAMETVFYTPHRMRKFPIKCRLKANSVKFRERRSIIARMGWGSPVNYTRDQRPQSIHWCATGRLIVTATILAVRIITSKWYRAKFRLQSSCHWGAYAIAYYAVVHVLSLPHPADAIYGNHFPRGKFANRAFSERSHTRQLYN